MSVADVDQGAVEEECGFLAAGFDIVARVLERVAHLNSLLEQAAAENPRDVVFVPGPPEWCDDPTISTDLNYRWDGIHVYKPGAKLIYETIADSLLEISV